MASAKFNVLIETYWNVNFYAAVTTVLIPLVLIETYWNVNLEATEYPLTRLTS